MSVLLKPDPDIQFTSEPVQAKVNDPSLTVPMEDRPEVKSYIYQTISEFEPFITSETVISVISKDPKKLARQYEMEDREFDLEDLKKQYRISISLQEGDAKLFAEGLDKDIFTAVRLAKESLMQKLMSIQDSVVTQQERNMAVYQAMQNTMIH
jgi:hypothetical protein